MIRPSVSMPVLQYDHFVTGSNSSGHWEIAIVAYARVRLRFA